MKELTEANNGHFIIFKEERPEESQDLSIKQSYFFGTHDIKLMKQYQDNMKDLFQEIPKTYATKTELAEVKQEVKKNANWFLDHLGIVFVAGYRDTCTTEFRPWDKLEPQLRHLFREPPKSDSISFRSLFNMNRR